MLAPRSHLWASNEEHLHQSLLPDYLSFSALYYRRSHRVVCLRRIMWSPKNSEALQVLRSLSRAAPWLSSIKAQGAVRSASVYVKGSSMSRAFQRSAFRSEPQVCVLRREES